MKAALDRKLIHQNSIFSFYEELWSPQDAVAPKPFYRFESNTWVNIIPITALNEVVMVKQFRYGSQSITLEIPGGLVDDTDLDPQTAAQRELLEETGYTTTSPVVQIATISPNPALFNNRVAFYLATNVVKVQEPRPDPHEALSGIELIPYENVAKHVLAGEVDHALVVCAFYLLDAWTRQHQAKSRSS